MRFVILPFVRRSFERIEIDCREFRFPSGKMPQISEWQSKFHFRINFTVGSRIKGDASITPSDTGVIDSGELASLQPAAMLSAFVSTASGFAETDATAGLVSRNSAQVSSQLSALQQVRLRPRALLQRPLPLGRGAVSGRLR